MQGILMKIDLISRRAGAYRSIKMGPDSEISESHISFVKIVCNHPGMSQEQLAGRLSLNKSTVARALNCLENQGFIQRTTDAGDRRVLLVYPTEKMKAIYPKVCEITEEWNNGLCRDISRDELSIFYTVLEKMKVRSQEMVDEAERTAKK